MKKLLIAVNRLYTLGIIIILSLREVRMCGICTCSLASLYASAVDLNDISTIDIAADNATGPDD